MNSMAAIQMSSGGVRRRSTATPPHTAAPSVERTSCLTSEPEILTMSGRLVERHEAVAFQEPHSRVTPGNQRVSRLAALAQVDVIDLDPGHTCPSGQVRGPTKQRTIVDSEQRDRPSRGPADPALGWRRSAGLAPRGGRHAQQQPVIQHRHRRRRGGHRCRLLRAVHAAQAARRDGPEGPGVRDRGRRRGHLVLEPLPGRAQRLRQLHLRLHLRRGALAGVGVE